MEAKRQKEIDALIKNVWEVQDQLIKGLSEILRQEYLERVSTLEGEKNELSARLEEMQKAEPSLQAITEAKIRVLAAEGDKLLSTGNIEKADSKRAEIEKIRAQTEERQKEIQDIKARLAVIAQDKTRIAQANLDELFPSLFPLASFGVIKGTVDFLDKAESTIDEYARETGAIARSYYWRQLVPSPTGKDRPLCERLKRWFYF